MNRTKKKVVLTAALFLVTVLTFTFSTMAYFSDSVTAMGGGIKTGDASVHVIDTMDASELLPDGSMWIMPGYQVARSVAVKNVGTLPVYVRVRVSSVIALAEAMQGRENEIDPSLVKLDINTEYWLLQGDYYYHRYPVLGGNTTMPLFTTVTFDKLMGNLYKDSSIQLEFTTHAVQANNNGTSFLDAAGWPEETGGQG